MLKKGLLFSLIIILSIFSFAEEKNLYVDLSKTITTNFNFDLNLKDIYSCRINYYLHFDKEKIETPEILDILSYMKFIQPGFEITYRNDKSVNDPSFFKRNYEGFTMTLDDTFYISTLDLSLGFRYDKNNFTSSYWINLPDMLNSVFSSMNKLLDVVFKNESLSITKLAPDFSRTEINIGYNIYNDIGLALNLSKTNGLQPMIHFNKLYLLVNINNMLPEGFYVVNKNFVFSYNRIKEKLNINSKFFSYNNDFFIFRVPIPLTKFLLFNYTTNGFGLSFDIPL